MIKFHFVYRPATKEYVCCFDSGSYGPHVAWSRSPICAFPFEKKSKANEVAEVLTVADQLITQVITIKEMGRSTIDVGATA